MYFKQMLLLLLASHSFSNRLYAIPYSDEKNSMSQVNRNGVDFEG